MRVWSGMANGYLMMLSGCSAYRSVISAIIRCRSCCSYAVCCKSSVSRERRRHASYIELKMNAQNLVDHVSPLHVFVSVPWFAWYIDMSRAHSVGMHPVNQSTGSSDIVVFLSHRTIWK